MEVLKDWMVQVDEYVLPGLVDPATPAYWESK
jgi:hypothetical protein